MNKIVKQMLKGNKLNTRNQNNPENRLKILSPLSTMGASLIDLLYVKTLLLKRTLDDLFPYSYSLIYFSTVFSLLFNEFSTNCVPGTKLYFL